MNNSKNIFFWSPFVSKVGTRLAVTNSIEALKKNTKHKLYLINLIGEFNDYSFTGIKKINFLDIKDFIPERGFSSKVCLWIISIFSIPWLIFTLKKNKADIIISNLVSIIPLFVNFFLRKKIICSIQGYPQFTFLRKILWYLLYKKANLIITMSEITKNEISNKIGFTNNITKIDNPIINKNIIKLSNQRLSNKEKKIFNKNTFICTGRLTRQKNFALAIKSFINFNKLKKFKYNLVILGEGEEENMLKSLSLPSKKNIFFLGYKKNPYKYIKSSKLFLSTSLWEDPGHALIEAAYLRIPIITNNCLAAPREIFNKTNCIKFNGQQQELEQKFMEFTKLNKSKINSLKKNAFKITKNFSKEEFIIKILKFL